MVILFLSAHLPCRQIHDIPYAISVGGCSCHAPIISPAVAGLGGAPSLWHKFHRDSISSGLSFIHATSRVWRKFYPKNLRHIQINLRIILCCQRLPTRWFSGVTIIFCGKCAKIIWYTRCQIKQVVITKNFGQVS